MENTYSDNTESKEQSRGVGGYRLLAALICILSVGGLFLGLLGRSVPALSHNYYSTVGGFLGGSLIASALNAMKSFFGGFPMYLSVFVKSGLQLLILVYALAEAVLSVVLFITTLAVRDKNKVKRIALTGAKLALLAYGLLFLWAYCSLCIEQSVFSTALFDVPVTIMAGLIFLVTAIASIASSSSPSTGFLNVLLLVFTVFTVFAFTYPLSATKAALPDIFSSMSQKPFETLALIVIAVVLLANIVISVLRLNAEKRFGLDAARYAVQFVLVLILAVAFCFTGGFNIKNFFGDGVLLPSVILIIAALGSLLLALLLVVKNRGKEVEAEEEEPVEEPLSEETPEEEPVEEPLLLSEEEPLPGEEPEPLPEEEPYPFEQLSEEEPLPEETDPIEAAPLFTDGSLPLAEEEPAPAEPEAEPELSDFERKMLAFAAAEPAAPAEPEPEAAQPQQPVMPPFYPYGRPYAAPTVPPVVQSYDPNSQYTYDPFIITLTTDEKNEFGDLFIACKHGTFGDLPVYRIGGDNKEFFSKVWIRYAMYDMTPQLKEKIFNYVRTYGKK